MRLGLHRITRLRSRLGAGVPDGLSAFRSSWFSGEASAISCPCWGKKSTGYATWRRRGGEAVLRHGRREEVRLEKVDPEHRAPVLKAYLKRAPGARPHLPVHKDAPLAEFDWVSPRFPVFRVVPSRMSDDERYNPGIKVPPPLIYLLPLILGLLLDRKAHLPFLPRRAARSLGWPLLGGGVLLSRW